MGNVTAPQFRGPKIERNESHGCSDRRCSVQAFDELTGEALGGLRRDCQRGFARKPLIVVFQTAKLWRGIQTFPATRSSADDRQIFQDFTTSSVFRGTGQLPTRSALLTANWRG